jgi:hypothetical protein
MKTLIALLFILVVICSCAINSNVVKPWPEDDVVIIIQNTLGVYSPLFLEKHMYSEENDGIIWMKKSEWEELVEKSQEWKDIENESFENKKLL